MIKGLKETAEISKNASTTNPIPIYYTFNNQTVTTDKPSKRRGHIHITDLIRENSEREILHALFRAMAM